MTIDMREIRHGHLFCGLGGGAKGFNRGQARVGNMVAKFRCVGGIDVDAAAVRDFDKLSGATGTVLDLFDRPQYVAFHGKEPPATWREALPEHIRKAFGYEHPHILFLSAPCKGFSGLLSETRSKSDKYQALNRLTLRGIWLTLEAYRDDPIELIVFENVPRIANRGRHLLDQITALLRSYGYAVAETTHDCGELGGLAQSRKRFLLVARHVEKVPPFLYEPEKKSLRAVGDVLGRMPMPGDLRAGPMHKLPALQWKTWVRLAFVEAGGDWRTLKKLNVKDGVLADYLLMPATLYRGAYGVKEWGQPAATVTSKNQPSSGHYAVADPRIDGHPKSVQHGVLGWKETAGVVTGKMFVGGGPHSIADPRLGERAGRQNNVFRVVRWSEVSPTVTAGVGPTAGGVAVADPRLNWGNGAHENKMRVAEWAHPSRVVTGSDRVGSGAMSIADPRTGFGDSTHHNVLHVTDWDSHAKTVTGSGHPTGGALAVADPRPAKPPEELHGKFHITPFDGPCRAIIGGRENGGCYVADPRPEWNRQGGNLHVVDWNEHAPVVHGGGKGVQGGSLSVADRRTGALGVIGWDESSGTVQGESFPSNGAFAVQDPRFGDPAWRGGPYGVLRWDKPSTTVAGSASTDNSFSSIADPRLPTADERLVALIVAIDGTWHRPFTTFELAGLQSLVDPEEQLALDGLSDSAWRERIGNAVPPEAAEAIAGVMGTTLLLAWSGETFVLGRTPIWVRQVAVALSVKPQ